MGNRSMEDLKDMICRELEEIAEKGEMSAGDLDTVYKLVMTKEKLLRIDEIEDGMGGSSYANRGKHYVRGHYSRSGYSMAEGKDMIMDEIREMLDDPNINEKERMSLERAMRALENK